MYYSFGPSETKAQKQKKAKKVVAKLAKTIKNIQPIEGFNGAIAKTFWGKSWCDNLELYADYGNRLPRGRSYLRAGCVCHLALEQGKITAKISGSSVYTVTVSLAPVKQHLWEELCKACVGHTGTLIELLTGKISKDVMELMCAEDTGLFPQEDELIFTCSCPDGAYMCKHVAATLYGIGRQLDSSPEILFTLRGVSAQDLVREKLDFGADTVDTDIDQDLGALFGIDLDMSATSATPAPSATPATPAPSATPANPKHGSESAFVSGSLSASVSVIEASAAPLASHCPILASFDSSRATGADIRALRIACHLCVKEFAEAVGVTMSTVRRWEKSAEILTIRAVPRKQLDALQHAAKNK